MSGIVGIIAQETARFSMFAASLTSLDAPEGTQVKWIFGHDIAANQNMLVEHMLTQDAEWLWLLGDDHSFSPDLLTKLLVHEVDIVVPLCLTRNTPYKPVSFSGFQIGDDGTPWRERIDLDQHPFGGLIPVHSAGGGGMLIQREVFEAVPSPWFQRPAGIQLAEDLFFCDQARETGFDIFCDLDARLGHCTTAVVWPVNDPAAGGWTHGFSFMGGVQFIVPKEST